MFMSVWPRFLAHPVFKRYHIVFTYKMSLSAYVSSQSGERGGRNKKGGGSGEGRKREEGGEKRSQGKVRRVCRW